MKAGMLIVLLSCAFLFAGSVFMYLSRSSEASYFFIFGLIGDSIGLMIIGRAVYQSMNRHLPESLKRR
jgi:hypothetical protein